MARDRLCLRSAGPAMAAAVARGGREALLSIAAGASGLQAARQLVSDARSTGEAQGGDRARAIPTAADPLRAESGPRALRSDLHLLRGSGAADGRARVQPRRQAP